MANITSDILAIEPFEPEISHLTTSSQMFMDVSQNTTSKSNGTIGMELGEAIAFISGTSICVVMTLVGNILVTLSVFTYRPLKSVQNFYIVSLAVADILVALCVMPFNVINYVVGYWIFGEILCNMWLTFDILMCTASILNLCAIAIDRYYAIHDPINYAQKRTIKRVVLTILVTWTASIVISVPPLLGWNNSRGRNLYDPVSRTCQLTDEPSFVVYSAMGSFFIPLFIMTFVYIKIFVATRRRLRKRAKAAALHHVTSRDNDTRKNDQTNKESDLDAADNSSCDNSPDPTTSCMEQKQTLLTPDSNGCDESTEQKLADCEKSSNGLLSPEDNHKDKVEPQNSRLNKQNSGGTDKNSNYGNRGNDHSIQHFIMEKQRISLSKERRAARTMAIIMGVFVLCWLPFFLMYIIFPFCNGCAAGMDGRAVNFIIWLGYINSTLNPVIYTVFNLDFRRAFKRLVNCKCINNR